MTRVVGDWLSRPDTQAVFAALGAGGHQAYAVGGCVRNALMKVAVADVDLATDARPRRITELCQAAGLKCVPTGIEHGTITVVAGGVGHEVTTFRADVETDGRRAVVRFSDDIAEDAARRDFTMNALYADVHGRVVDPLGGLPDLRARRVRFIRDADARIREDFLRILRFFRFNAWYGDPDQGFDPEALAGISANLDGLARLSSERIGHEVVKLLSAPNPAMSVSVMGQTGVLNRILPGAATEAIAPLVHNEQSLELKPEPMLRLAALGFADGASLRLSRADQKQLASYLDLVASAQGLAELAYRYCPKRAKEVAALRAAITGAPIPSDLSDQVEAGANARFPAKASDLMGQFEGAQLGNKLRELETRWIESGFQLTRAELLE